MHLKILALLTIISIILISIAAHFVFPEFEAMFSGFGADLPFLTRALLASYPYLPVALLLPLGIYLKYLTKPHLTINEHNGILFSFVAMLLFLLLLLPLTIFILYLPIFEMGAALH